ncbi:hypothetical protein FRC10_005829 [Ceratobasidium sp. 414]|nr:hypothetical protein FRC10_005829 [Ceratobasidium sp. 414]
MANELDAVLQGLSRHLGSSPLSTIALVTQAREKDGAFVDQFVERMDQASPVPGVFARAYRNRDAGQLDSYIGQVFDAQTHVLSRSPELQDNDFQNAQKLTNLIMNVTRKKPDPKILLGRGFVGQWQPLQTTSRYDLFLASYVTEETVVVKVMRNKINGRDRNTQLARFQKYVEVWASLRSDFTLPFHGIGMSERDGQSQMWVITVTYHEICSVTAAESLQIALDAAFGLRYLHERRPAIVHSGIRTDNILIDDSGRGVLAGFRLTDEADGVISHTGFNNDSYRFLPPELFADKPPPRKTSADVWSWAMVALHLVGGKKPFPSFNDFQAGKSVLDGLRPERGDYPRILEILDPDGFWGILVDCWAQDEDKRPDMDVVVSRMKQVIKGNEVIKPVPVRPADKAFVDDQPDDGRSQPPVRQVSPRRWEH